MLQLVIRSSHTLKEMIDRTLVLARLNSPSHHFEKEAVNLSNLIEEIVDTYRNIDKDKKFVFTIESDKNIMIHADKIQIREVIDNLISNAIKYSPNGGKITIKVENDKKKVKLSIIDEGIGMRQSEIDHVFEEFYKADGSRHDTTSFGLGLAICSRIIRGHGGNIAAKSQGVGKGSIFYFTLPVNKKIIESDFSEKIDNLLKDKNM